MTVYTCQTPGYDAPRTDILNIAPMDIFKSDRLNAKMPKILPHLFVDDGITIWCDANIFLNDANLREIEQKLKQADVVVLTHPHRNCAYEEAQVCIDAGLDDADKIREQVKMYQSAKWPKNAGLYGCGVVACNLLRENRWLLLRSFEIWWAHITRWSSRDQISFPVIFSKHRIATISFQSVEIRPHL